MLILRYTAPMFASRSLIERVIYTKAYWFPAPQVQPATAPLTYYTDKRKTLLIGPKAKETADLLLRAFGGFIETLEDKTDQ